MKTPRKPDPSGTLIGNPGPRPNPAAAPAPEDDEEDSFWDKLLANQPAPLKPGK